jgi:MinD-like ATPase involved in chromosome partitioning or flagellar assembly
MKLLTWLDIRRVVARKTNFYHNLPPNISRIGCFSDALEIGIKTSDDKEKASQILKEWFGDWYKEDKSIIHLDLEDSVLAVEFIDGENPLNSNTSIFPFWQEISYLESQDSEDNSQAKNIQYPEPFAPKTNLVAFHSFKGGVGRTLHLVAYLFALLDRAKELNQAITLLIIDADLEAPGLTYLNANEAMQPEVSFIDFLEVYHYPPIENSLDLFANKIKKSSKQEGKSTIYFLPAFVKEEQLLDTPVLPENLARNLNNHWGCADAIYELGRILNADYVLIDLRAGLSEISSPLLFDPRVERFLVTTLNKQSVKGTSLVLKQINHVAPLEDKVREGEYSDPSIIITMLTDILKKSSDYEDAVTELQKSYKELQEENLVDTRIRINDTFFAEELMYINTWEEAREKLSGTPVFESAQVWSNSKLISDDHDDQDIYDISDIYNKVNQLKETCHKYIYAEEGESEELLITEPLKNLASNFQDSLPNIVSLGSKGAGKTFNYIQLSRLKKWDDFLQKANIIKINKNQIEPTYIFPFLQSTNLKDKALSIVDEVRQDFLTQLDSDIDIPTFSFSDLRGRINSTVDNELTENEWTDFWVREIGRSLGIVSNDDSILKLSDINNNLKSRSLRVIYLFDGLEDIFSTISSKNSLEQEQIALKSLIDNLPLKLSEIRQANLGIIIFLRRDFLRHTITQNVLQFENKYRAYDLIWDEISFLKLSLWLCIQANVIDYEPEELETLGREGLQDKLEQLWGKKLGKDESKEAYSYLWIFNALTDFKNRLQARDIVRFLYFAAEKTVDNSKNAQFTKWASSRLLPPQAVRRALEPCSKKKVEEAKEEYAMFKTWVDSLSEFRDRKVPFASQQLKMDSLTIDLLKEMGVIYEDIAKDEVERFYIPEIFREGLGFSYGKGARPRVLALKRKSS